MMTGFVPETLETGAGAQTQIQQAEESPLQMFLSKPKIKSHFKLSKSERTKSRINKPRPKALNQNCATDQGTGRNREHFNKDTQRQHNKLIDANMLTFIHKEGQVDEEQVKLIRAGQIITVEGK